MCYNHPNSPKIIQLPLGAVFKRRKMSRIEQLRRKLTSVREEAMRQEATGKEALRQAEEQKKRKLEAEAAEKKLIEENWQLAKDTTLEFFQEINREILNGRGRITKGRCETVHEHHYKASENIHEPFVTVYFQTRCSTNNLNLCIPGLVLVSLFRVVEYGTANKSAERGFSNTGEWGKKRRVYIGYGYKIGDEVRDTFCPNCVGISSVSLNSPAEKIVSQVEEAISEQFSKAYRV